MKKNPGFKFRFSKISFKKPEKPLLTKNKPLFLKSVKLRNFNDSKYSSSNCTALNDKCK